MINTESSMSEYDVVEIERGTGLICPEDNCEARFIINLDRVKNCPGKRMNSRTLICPVCERRNLLPK